MIFEILGYGTDNGALVHLIILAHARTIHYTGEGIDDAIVAYLHITLDIGKRHNSHVLAELCLWVYVCFVGNHFILEVKGVIRSYRGLQPLRS